MLLRFRRGTRSPKCARSPAPTFIPMSSLGPTAARSKCGLVAAADDRSRGRRALLPAWADLRGVHSAFVAGHAIHPIANLVNLGFGRHSPAFAVFKNIARRLRFESVDNCQSIE